MQTHESNPTQPLLMCNPSAIAPAEREAHATLAKYLYSAEVVQETRELANGYGFRLPLETAMLHNAIRYIANERLCCSFFTFTLVVGDQLWLELSGSPEIKALIEAEVLPLIASGQFPTFDELQADYDEAVAQRRASN